VRSVPALVVVALALGCDPPASAEAPEPAPADRKPRSVDDGTPEPEPRTVLWIGGDVLLSGAIRRSVRADGDAAGGFARLLEPVAERWRADGADAFVLVNLESPVVTRQRSFPDDFLHLDRGPGRVPAPLNAPAWLLDGLKRADVDAVMLANNHALDQDREGLAETLDAARRAGLVTTGAGRAPHLGWPVVVGREGARTAVLTFFEKDYPEPDLPDGEAGVSVLGPGSVDRVRRARGRNDAVVVVVHVVSELLDRAKPRWRRWSRELAEAGADAIAIHGTHVPGPVETLAVGRRRAVVAYGLGNLVSDMGSGASPGRAAPRNAGKWQEPATREGLLARVEVRGGRVDVRLLLTWMGNDRYLVHNRVLDGPLLRFELVPLAACSPAALLPRTWPSPWRDEMAAWIDRRRDHLLEVSELRPAGGCEPGRAALLPPPGAQVGGVLRMR